MRSGRAVRDKGPQIETAGYPVGKPSWTGSLGPGIHDQRASGGGGPNSDISDVLVCHVKDVMDMDLDELIQKYNRTLRVVGLLRCMLETHHGVTKEREQKMWSLVRHTEFQEFPAWKRHTVWSF